MIVGEQYREIRNPSRIWEIVHILQAKHGVAHARIRLSTDHTVVKLLSHNSIEDIDLFKRLRDC